MGQGQGQGETLLLKMGTIGDRKTTKQYVTTYWRVANKGRSLLKMGNRMTASQFVTAGERKEVVKDG